MLVEKEVVENIRVECYLLQLKYIFGNFLDCSWDRNWIYKLKVRKRVENI